jgi:hypothetical protein
MPSQSFLPTEAYRVQVAHWPISGRYLLAHFDSDSIVVYQAFSPAIADFAVNNQRFGGPFSLSRMSWIKPNFLWMMFRSGWATKPSQERVLAVRLRRDFFEGLLKLAVASAFRPDVHASPESWQKDVARSDVRLQWDPDHSPSGTPLARRAIQLGLRRDALAEYAKSPIEILDATPFVSAEHANAVPPYQRLTTPVERCFFPADAAAARNIGLDSVESAEFREPVPMP